MKRGQRPVILIGAGAVASSLGLAFRRAGWRVLGVYSRSGVSAGRLGRRLGSHRNGGLGKLRDAEAALLLIAVPDDSVPAVVSTLVRLPVSLRSSIILHTSGTLTSDVLAPLRRRGAAVGSFHPLQTFPRKRMNGREVSGIWFGVEGDARAVRAARECASAISGHSIVIPRRQKALYHMAAVFASNYLVTLLSVVEELGAAMGLSPRSVESMFAPLIESTFANVRSLSPSKALTGPIARRDLTTVERHLGVLSKPSLRHLLPLYTALGLATARLAFRKNAHHDR